MADNNNYDDYELADLDATSGLDSTVPDTNDTQTNHVREKPILDHTNIKRNAIVAVVFFIVVMGIYEFTASSGKQPVIVPVVNKPQPIAPVTPMVSLDAEMNKKLSVLDLSQQSLRADVASANNQLSAQLGEVTANMNTLVTKMTALDASITQFAAKIEAQSQEIERLTRQAAASKRKLTASTHHVMKQAPIQYYIQAVIPGRAWLIASNGMTQTVREGTMIAGLGVVKLIDPRQGRVVTSSGRVIRFSQEDS